MGPLEFTRITSAVCRSRAALLEVIERNNPGRPIKIPSIEILHVEDTGPNIVVRVHERTPSLGDPVQVRVTYPYRLITLPRSDKPVKLKWPGRP